MIKPMTEPAQSTPSSPGAGLDRRHLLYAAVAAAAGLGGATMAWWKLGAPRDEVRVDPALWLRKFETPGGAAMVMSAFQGKPLLLNFWATWCPPCVEEMPLLDRFYRENSAKGWQVVGLAVDRPQAVRRFLTDFPVSFAIGLAESEGAELGRSLGNLSGGLPFTLVLGASGAVLQRKIGRLAETDLRTLAHMEAAT